MSAPEVESTPAAASEMIAPEAESVTLALVPPQMRADPHPIYHQLRAHAPLQRVSEHFWVATGYDVCRSLLRDPRLSVESAHANNHEEILARSNRGPLLRELTDASMLFRDPPDHTRLRGLVQRAFTPRIIESWGERVSEVSDQLLDDLTQRLEIDVLADFAWPMPVIVIAEMLGVPIDERERFRGWARDLALTIEPVLSDEQAARAEEAARAFREFFAQLIAERRRDPQEDLLTALIEAEEAGERLTEGELVANIVLLLIAGHETTMNLIGNGLYALLRNPGQLERLRANPGLAADAVEEIVRFDGSVHLTHRIALEDLDSGEGVIPRGEHVLLIIAAANRDPAEFVEPDRLDLEREHNRHLGFGGGPHFCLGNALARLEARIALPRLLQRLGQISLAEPEPRYRETLVLRGLDQLRVAPAEGKRFREW